jgi:hypothetical protein
VDPDEHIRGARHFSLDQGDVVLLVDEGAVPHDAEIPEDGGEIGLDHPLDEQIVDSAIGNQIRDGYPSRIDHNRSQGVAADLGDELRTASLSSVACGVAPR